MSMRGIVSGRESRGNTQAPEPGSPGNKTPRSSLHSWLGYRIGIDFLGKQWCRRGESNPRPRDYETLALPLSYAGKTQFFMLRTNRQKCQVTPTPAIGVSARPICLPAASTAHALTCAPSPDRFRDKTATKAFRRIVLPYHPTWNFSTLAAIRFGTLDSLPAEAASSLAWRRPGESTRLCSVDGYAQSRSVPYLTLS